MSDGSSPGSLRGSRRHHLHFSGGELRLREGKQLLQGHTAVIPGQGSASRLTPTLHAVYT